MACVAAADARGHAFDELCPSARPATRSRVGEAAALSGVGLDVRDWRPAEPERSWGTAGEEGSSGRGVSTRERRSCWCSATTPLRPLRSVINRRDAAARKESVRRARTSTDLDRAPQQVLYIPLLCGHRNKRRPRSARNKAARASRQKTPREALTITPSARASRAQNHGRL